MMWQPGNIIKPTFPPPKLQPLQVVEPLRLVPLTMGSTGQHLFPICAKLLA
eukprot:CAMPEP_0115550696 /NCGR_PEP_ID=MMETSP0271-20121206/95355_1 /TAXON_ID=71861 /ORGANISM="Scrippsiella trochoidea, Strain CCMP3099" /LENGTH=50 /DNA_ID=CAMNT_0002984287 /DNA_START=449 /DNA_END=601 /DNA_ORIENTATION=+